ncbi:MAG TPA: glycosyltransferase family 2 protein [Candidatus Baltobacteraceae bacterium]|nr:glycosyltransferase family 2 protein [Candidatus Baltobacteraceae bacterium]
MATFSVCIPSYNAASVIGATLESLVRQTFTDWECVVVDDGSTDGTEDAVRRIADPRIRFFKNERNLGYPGNLQRCRDLAQGTYIYFLANDDILSPLALQRTYEAFQLAPDIAVVTRPYYWFENDDPETAIRYTVPLDTKQDRIISAHDDDQTLRAIFDVMGQVTALAYRTEWFTVPVNPHVWPAHIEPFFAMLKAHRGVFMHDYLVAVRLEHSQARTVPKIYDPSPLWTWVNMLNSVFPGQEWKRQRSVGIDNIARHVEGLVQLRKYSTIGCFLREAWLYLKYRPLNGLSLRYWFFALGCLFTPPAVLRRLVDLLMPRVTKASAAEIQTIGTTKAA